MWILSSGVENESRFHPNGTSHLKGHGVAEPNVCATITQQYTLLAGWILFMAVLMTGCPWCLIKAWSSCNTGGAPARKSVSTLRSLKLFKVKSRSYLSSIFIVALTRTNVARDQHCFRNKTKTFFAFNTKTSNMSYCTSYACYIGFNLIKSLEK